jgi:hypothetical protein
MRHTRLYEQIIGSTTERLVRLALCTILVVSVNADASGWTSPVFRLHVGRSLPAATHDHDRRISTLPGHSA